MSFRQIEDMILVAGACGFRGPRLIFMLRHQDLKEDGTQEGSDLKLGVPSLTDISTSGRAQKPQEVPRSEETM